MATRCPNCKRIFVDDKSYQNHFPCESASTYGGASDLREDQFGQEYAKKGGTDEY